MITLKQVPFPSREQFEDLLQQQVEVHPGESVAFRDLPVAMKIPDMLLADWNSVAEQIQWTLGEVLLYLAVQGTIRVIEQAECAENN